MTKLVDMKRLILLLLIPFGAIGQNKTDLIKITDMLQIKQMSGLSMSPDGSKAVFVLNSIEQDGESKWEYKYNNQLYLVATDGSAAPKALTNKESAGQPSWSPDGKQLAFVRTVDGKPQIFLLSFDGGEPIQLTKFKYGASNPKWSPDGKQMVFGASVSFKDLLKDSILNPGKGLPKWPMEKPGFDQNEFLKTSSAKPDPDGTLEEMRAYLELNATDRKAKVFNKLNFQEEATTSPELSFSHVFVTAVQPNATPIAITKGFYRFGNAVFSSDGSTIIFTGSMNDKEHPDRVQESQIFTAFSNGTNMKMLLGASGKTYSSPSVSPSGKWLAFQMGLTNTVDIPSLAVMPLGGNLSEATLLPFDRNKGGLNWSNDEKFIYFNAQSNGGAPIYRVDVKTKAVEQLTESAAGISSYDLRNNKLVFVKTEVANPFEIYTSDAVGKNAQRISSFNYNWVSKKQLSLPEKKTFKNEKGQTVEYWVMKPTNYEAGKKYPAILDIHGGPSAMWGPGESSMWHEFQYYCAKGYVVVYGNPRGSGGYGTEFLRANINDWGTGPTSDVLTSLDLAATDGFIDTSKLTVTGGSYAGYLVAWIVGHDQRFKAACAQRGVYDLGTFFGEGNAWRLVPNYFGGYPWDEKSKAIIERESPIKYVANIRTPLIIFHGENDLRTGVIQSEMLYRSLKVLGRTVEYVRHPGGTHELTRTGNNRQRIDQMLRTMEFFERFIKH
jgi:dipeptidyl aminopeptidase/acylaminoacyl peptidase